MKQLLQDLGLSKGESDIYASLVTLGTTTVNKIQEKVSIERRNIYDILNKLIEKGLVTYTEENKKKTFQITHPNKLQQYLHEKEEHIHQQQEILAKNLPELLHSFNENKEPIRAEVFRGNEAVKALFEEMLECKEIRILGGNTFENFSVPKSFQRWFSHWMERRAKRKVWMLDLVDKGTFLPGLLPTDKKRHKESYYKYAELPENLQSPLVIVIFGKKVAQILWGEQSFAFVLESDKVQQSFLAYFNAYWPKQ